MTCDPARRRAVTHSADGLDGGDYRWSYRWTFVDGDDGTGNSSA